MKLIRHLLSHILLLVFIVGLVLAYFYRTVVFSEQTNTHINRYISNPIQSALVYAGLSSKPIKKDNKEIIKNNDILVKDCEEEKASNESLSDPEVSNTESAATKLVVIEETLLTEQDINQEDISNHEIEEQQENNVEPEGNITDEVVLDVEITEATDTSDVESEVVENEVVESEVVESEVVENEVVESEVVESEVVKSEVVENEVVENEVVENEVVENEVVENEVVENEVVESVNKSPEELELIQSGTTEKSQTTGKSYFGLINQARLAYQAGNIDQTISHYLELIENFPEDPNAQGELGNVYYSKGLWKQASKAYYQAAIQLMKLENRDQLQHLHRVIRGLDPDTANELLNKLEDS